MSDSNQLPSGRILIVVAHPDDETLGCGGELWRWPDAVIAHTTGGSPSSPDDARNAGFDTREAYAEARRRELSCALAEVGGRELRGLGFTDQESWRQLAALTRAVRRLVEEIRPDAIISHPYEGGHPDHDAAALAVQRACKGCGSMDGAGGPLRVEAAFYNRYDGVFRTGEFVPGARDGLGAGELGTGELSPEASARKRRMLDCFASQQEILRRFGTQFERYRLAPDYDFTEPPHAGVLNYETLGWGITWGMWRGEADRAESVRI